MVIASKLGIYDLLLDFQKKHVHGSEATRDFTVILQKFKENEDN